MEESRRGNTAATDGGSKAELRAEGYKRSSWRVYVVCCAIIGGVIGLFWGPAGVIGLAVLGAMIGDEWARRTLEE